MLTIQSFDHLLYTKVRRKKCGTVYQIISIAFHRGYICGWLSAPPSTGARSGYRRIEQIFKDYTTVVE